MEKNKNWFKKSSTVYNAQKEVINKKNRKRAFQILNIIWIVGLNITFYIICKTWYDWKLWFIFLIYSSLDASLRRLKSK